MEQFSRTELIYGKEKIDALQQCHIAIFGLGGVGSYAAEALARTGVKKLTLVDFDTVELSNLNRQLPALHSTLHQKKADVMAKRLQDINPSIELTVITEKYTAENRTLFFQSPYDFVLDCIDMVSSKIDLITHCLSQNIPIISSMGMASHSDPSKVHVSDLSKTHMCPLAKVMRKELKERGILHLPVVFSEEKAISPSEKRFNEQGRQINGSLAFVTGTAGMFMSGYVINSLLSEDK